jgi:hypothetical protein
VRHPTESALALYAGRDLGFGSRLRVGAHVRGCGHCRSRVEQYREVRGWLGEQEEDMPADVDFGKLAAEIRANIRLGLAAGECVAAEPVHRISAGWLRPATVLPVLVVVVAGWILQSLQPPLRPGALMGAGEAGVVLAASSSGIGLEKDGRGLTLLNPHAGTVVSSVRGDALRVRYVDIDTGQVTISHVYAQ